MLEELTRESQRQDRSISWLIQQAWKVARAEMRRIPSTTDFIPEVAYDSTPVEPGEDPERNRR
jgi:uncharacterized small protein (TIGR04563 family)